MRVLLGLALLLTMTSAREVCPADGNTCVEQPVAIKKTTRSSPTDHYYIGGLFGIHNKGETAYACDDTIRLRGLMNLQAFLWAISYFEQRIPGSDNGLVSIGGVAFDNCLRKEETIENIMSFEQCRTRLAGVDRRQLLAFVGPDTSSEALAVAALVKDLQLTVVSHAATSPELSDAIEYPYFLRTVPSDANDAAILAAVLSEQLNSKYTQFIYIDNDYGRAGRDKFREMAEARNICIVQEIAVMDNVSSTAQSEVIPKLKEMENVKYVVLFTDGTTANKILNSLYAFNAQSGIQNTNFIFLGTSSWGNSVSVLSGGVFSANNSLVASLAVDPAYDSAIEDFRQYWANLKPNDQGQNIENQYLIEYWESRFNCVVGGTGSNACDLTNQNLGSLELDVYVPYTIMAVDAIVRGIYKASLSNCDNYNLCSDLMNIVNRGSSIYDNIKTVRLQSDETRFLFDTNLKNEKYISTDPSGNSDGFTRYNVYQVVDNRYSQFATYVPTDGLIPTRALDTNIYRDMSVCDYPCTVCGEMTTTRAPTTVQTTSPASTTPKDPTEGGNFTFVKFPTTQELTGAYFSAPRSGEMWMTRFEIGQKWIIALGVLAGLGIVAVIIFEIYILYKLLGTRMGSRWRTMWLGQLLLFGIFLSYLTLFAFIFIPTKATCGITRFGVGVSYSVMFAVLLVKLMVILTSKTSEASLLPGDMESPNYLKGIYQFLMFMFAVGVQVVIDAQWLITVPPEAVLVSDNMGAEVWICNHYTWRVNDGMLNMTTFVRNEFENHLLSLVYIMFLVLITTVLALNAHGIITNHRESIFIGIASGFTIPIWLSWGLVGGLNRGNNFAQEFGDACIAFGLFLTATLILFAMFLPKVRQLVNIGVEGIYFEDDRETYYAGSVIMSPPSYKSKANSVLYVNNQGIYSEPVLVGNGDPMATHLKHPGHQPGPMSTYSAPPGFMKKGDSGPGSKVLRVTPDLTGKYPTERRRPQSEFAYAPRSVKGTLKRSRSQQNLGAL